MVNWLQGSNSMEDRHSGGIQEVEREDRDRDPQRWMWKKKKRGTRYKSISFQFTPMVTHLPAAHLAINPKMNIAPPWFSHLPKAPHWTCVTFGDTLNINSNILYSLSNLPSVLLWGPHLMLKVLTKWLNFMSWLKFT